MSVKTLPPELRAAILAEVERTPSLDAGAVRRSHMVAIALGVGTAAIMLGTLGLALGGRPITFVALSAVGWAAVATVATLVGGLRGRSMLGRARLTLVVVTVAVAPLIYGWVMSCTLGWPELREPAGTWHQHVACLLATALLSLGPLIAFTFVRRATDPVHPRATGAAMGAAAGAWGGVLIDMHCPLVHPFHVAIAHVLPVLVYAAIGALVGARLFGVHAKGDKG